MIAAAQAALLTLLLHLVAGVGWQLLPATLAFSLVAAAAFTAFHYLLTIGLGRAGLVISLFLLAVQLASTGTILPVQALSGPFAWISGLLPLSWATTGMQQIIAGRDAAPRSRPPSGCWPSESRVSRSPGSRSGAPGARAHSGFLLPAAA